MYWEETDPDARDARQERRSDRRREHRTQHVRNDRRPTDRRLHRVASNAPKYRIDRFYLGEDDD